MNDYRIYVLLRGVRRVGSNVKCESDREAGELARSCLTGPGEQAEIWSGTRLVANIDALQPSDITQITNLSA